MKLQEVVIDTTDRSYAYYRKNVVDIETWFKIANVDYIELNKAFDFDGFLADFLQPVKLLDIGCGTGAFPELLRPYLRQDLKIQYDYLDPSSYCLNEIKSLFKGQYQQGLALQDTIENINIAYAGQYDFIWAIHSLTNWRRSHLQESTEKIKALLNPQHGIAMVFNLSDLSFYAEIYKLYSRIFRNNQLPSLISSEEFMSVLTDLGIAFVHKRLCYVHELNRKLQPYVMEKYLQKCVLDSLTLETWFSIPETSQFLNTFCKDDGAIYRFTQTADVICFSVDKSNLNQLKKYGLST